MDKFVQKLYYARCPLLGYIFWNIFFALFFELFFTKFCTTFKNLILDFSGPCFWTFLGFFNKSKYTLKRFWNNVQRWVAAAECAATACCTMLALPPESQSSDYVVVPEKEKSKASKMVSW